MSTLSAKVSQGGRLVLPAVIRRCMNLEEGEILMLEMKGKVLQITSLRDRLDAVQSACSPFLSGGGVVDEFLEERRREAASDAD